MPAMMRSVSAALGIWATSLIFVMRELEQSQPLCSATRTHNLLLICARRTDCFLLNLRPGYAILQPLLLVLL